MNENYLKRTGGNDIYREMLDVITKALNEKGAEEISIKDLDYRNGEYYVIVWVDNKIIAAIGHSINAVAESAIEMYNQHAVIS